MIDFGVEYGYSTTGATLVFLRLQRDNLETIYYHMVMPNEDVVNKDGLFYTAAAQVACFYLMARKSKMERLKLGDNARKVLQSWPNLYSGIEYGPTDDEQSIKA